MVDTLRKFTFSDIITYLQVFSLWLLVAILPMRFGSLPRIIMIVAGILFVAEYVINKRWQTWRWHRNKWLYVAMIIYYLFIPFWQIFSDTLSPFYYVALERRIAFLFCGVIGLLGFNQYVKLSHLCIVFLLTAIGTSLYIIFTIGGWDFFTHDWGQQSFLFSQMRILRLNNHMIYNMYLNISLVASFYLINTLLRKPWQLALVVLSAIWIFFILCLTEGRVGLFTSFLLVAFFMVVIVAKYSWKLLLVLSPIFIGIVSWVIIHNQRIEIERITHDPREMIWKAGWKNVQVSPILGQGVSQAKESLVSIAQDDKDLWAFWNSHVQNRWKGSTLPIRTHNAFLEVWAEFGLIGLITLLFLFIYPLTMSPKKHRIYILMIVGCVSIQCLFDAFLAPILYCLPIIFFTFQSEISSGNVSQTPDAT